MDKRNKAGGFTPLHCACSQEHIKIVDALLASGASVHIVDDENWRPGHYAADRGNIDILEVLLEKNSDPNAQTVEGYTPAYLAAQV